MKGTLFEEIGTIVSAACLAHDLGNPPFGHSGEMAIRTYFTEGPGERLRTSVDPGFWDDITHFEGNANAFRLLTHRFLGRRPGGFVMTYSTLGFRSEAPTYEKIAEEMGILRKSAPGAPMLYARHPLVYLVEAADDICYEIMDIEDSHKLRILSFEETRQLLLGFFDEKTQESILRRIEEEGVTDQNEQVVYFRACAVGKLENACVDVFVAHEDEILAGTFSGSLIDHIDEPMNAAYKACETTSYRKIYHSKPVLDVELSGYKIMETLLDTFVDAAVHPQQFHSQQLMRRVSSQYDIQNPRLEDRLMAVVDYISGMTDVYALDIYQKINGISLPIV